MSAAFFTCALSIIHIFSLSAAFLSTRTTERLCNPQKPLPSLEDENNCGIILSDLSKTEANNSTDDALLGALCTFTPSLDATRIFHGRGGFYPGCEHLTVDWYPPVVVITSFESVDAGACTRWEHALQQRWVDLGRTDPLTWAYQDRSISPAQTELMSGQIPDPHVVTENGNQYVVQILKGQNHGLFLDMAKGREWVQQNALGRNILNMFAYSCSFSIAALRGGASSVVNIDMNQGAIKLGQRNHELNRLDRATFLKHDIFKSWGKLKRYGPYDLIICDPPSYQKGSFVAKNDYAMVIRRLPSLLNPGGYALLCLNAPELDTSWLMNLVEEVAPDLLFLERMKNPDTFPVADHERALKVLLFQLRNFS
jgi:23S rRNA (cytosine1962-C5)-methyltransferase